MSKQKPAPVIDPVAAALNRARVELEKLGASSRLSLETAKSLAEAEVKNGIDCGIPAPWWATYSDYELGLKRLQIGRQEDRPRFEHIAFLLIATDDLHEEWNNTRPCGTSPSDGCKQRTEELRQRAEEQRRCEEERSKFPDALPF